MNYRKEEVYYLENKFLCKMACRILTSRNDTKRKELAIDFWYVAYKLIPELGHVNCTLTATNVKHGLLSNFRIIVT